MNFTLTACRQRHPKRLILLKKETLNNVFFVWNEKNVIILHEQKVPAGIVP